MPQPMCLTREGLEKLETELEHLRTVRRSDVAERIQQSREKGSTAGNAEYEEAKNELAFIEGRILTLANIINNAVLIEERQGGGDRVDIGSTVTVKTRMGRPNNTPSPAPPKPTLPKGRFPTCLPSGRACSARGPGNSPR